MTVSSHKSKIGITGAVQSGTVDITDTDAVQSTVLTITLANGTILTATEGTGATSTDINVMTYVAATGSSGSKRTSAAASLAGALNANGNLTATSASSVVTITEVYGGTGGSLSHPGGGMSVVDWSGGAVSSERADKHTVAAGGTAGGYNSTANIKSNMDLVKGRKMSGSKVIAKTGTATNPGVSLARSGGTLAYNPQSRSVTLSTSNIGWLIRGGTATLLSGIAATANVLSIPGSDTTSRFAGSVHELRSYRRQGLWSDTILDLFNGKVYDADGNAKSTISGWGTKVELTGIDGAAYDNQPTRAIPGELVILHNFVSYSTNMVDYSALNG